MSMVVALVRCPSGRVIVDNLRISCDTTDPEIFLDELRAAGFEILYWYRVQEKNCR